jgi:hypothetical protein
MLEQLPEDLLAQGDSLHLIGAVHGTENAALSHATLVDWTSKVPDMRENAGRTSDGGRVFSIPWRRAVNLWVAVYRSDCQDKKFILSAN